MKKIKFINSRFDAEWSFQLNDGRIIEVKPFGGAWDDFALTFSTPFNLETGEIGERTEYKPFSNPHGLPDTCPDGFTTLNNLIALHQGKELRCYDVFDVDLDFPRTMSQRRVDKIRETFKRNGFKVTSEAIWHNYVAWSHGWKSGYRDGRNGYHLFTPCGGNPFSLRATTLNEHCRDWQSTYTC